MDRRGLEEIDESLLDVFNVIRKKPSLYLGSVSLSRLNAFVYGYESGLGRAGKKWRHESQLAGLNEWIAARLGFDSSTSGWSGMILNRILDERLAYEKFYELLDQFVEIQRQSDSAD